MLRNDPSPDPDKEAALAAYTEALKELEEQSNDEEDEQDQLE